MKADIRADGNMMSKKANIPRMFLRHIEEVVGVVDPNDEHKFTSFQGVDDVTISRARELYYQLDEIRAACYLKFFLPKSVERSRIVSFLANVVLGDMDAEEWARRESSSQDGQSESRVQST